MTKSPTISPGPPTWGVEACALLAALVVAMSVASLNLRGHEVRPHNNRSAWAPTYQGWPLTYFELTWGRPIIHNTRTLPRMTFDIVFGLILVAATQQYFRRHLIGSGWPRFALGEFLLLPVALALTLLTFRHWVFDEQQQYVHAAIVLVGIACLLGEVLRLVPRRKKSASTYVTSDSP